MTDHADGTNGDASTASMGASDDDRTRRAVQAATTASPLPFQDLRAPLPTRAAPPAAARWGAFASILVGGLLGGLIGYGTGDLMASSSVVAAAGGLAGAAAGAIGVGIVASLTLRAMNEWHAVQHPEALDTAADHELGDLDTPSLDTAPEPTNDDDTAPEPGAYDDVDDDEDR